MVTRLRNPPATLPADPPTWTWRREVPLVRIYHERLDQDGFAPRRFGPLARFDPHVRDRRQRPREDPEGRGVSYLARELGTALAEAYPDQRPQVAICRHARAVWVLPSRPVALLDLTGEGAMAIGAVGTLAWGDERRRLTQRWARRIYEQYTDLDGIRYRAAHQGGESVALWERAPAVERAPGGDRALWAVWPYVTVALADQRRQPRRVSVDDCALCAEYRA